VNEITKRIRDEYGNTLRFELVPDSLKELDAPLAKLFWRQNVRVLVRKQPNSDASAQFLNYKEFFAVYALVEQHRDGLLDQIRSLDSSSAGAPLPERATTASSGGDEADNECVICFERKPDQVLACGHGFCGKCLADWNARQNNCPMCRSEDATTDAWLLTTNPSRQELFDFFQSFIELARANQSE